MDISWGRIANTIYNQQLHQSSLPKAFSMTSIGSRDPEAQFPRKRVLPTSLLPSFVCGMCPVETLALKYATTEL